MTTLTQKMRFELDKQWKTAKGELAFILNMSGVQNVLAQIDEKFEDAIKQIDVQERADAEIRLHMFRESRANLLALGQSADALALDYDRLDSISHFRLFLCSGDRNMKELLKELEKAAIPATEQMKSYLLVEELHGALSAFAGRNEHAFKDIKMGLASKPLNDLFDNQVIRRFDSISKDPAKITDSFLSTLFVPLEAVNKDGLIYVRKVMVEIRDQILGTKLHGKIQSLLTEYDNAILTPYYQKFLDCEQLRKKGGVSK